MSAMIWDSAAQAFAEPQNVPKRYDAGSGAFVDTEGMVWNAETQAWEKAWTFVEKPLIPNITSYAGMKNNGVGIAAVDSVLPSVPDEDYFAWQAFDNNGKTSWVSAYTSNEHYASFVFDKMTRVKRVEVFFRSTPASIYQPIAHIQYTEDGSTWADLWEGRTNDGTENSDKTISTYLNKTIKGVRIYTPSGYSGTSKQKYLGARYIRCWK